MAKKSAMQKEVEKSECKPDNSKVPSGEQMDLIEHHPENEKEIGLVARAYRKKIAERQRIQDGKDGEFELKEKLRDLINKSNPKRDSKGNVRLKVDGIKIEVTATKDKIKVTEDKE